MGYKTNLFGLNPGLQTPALPRDCNTTWCIRGKFVPCKTKIGSLIIDVTVHYSDIGKAIEY